MDNAPGRQERQGAAVMPAGLKPANFDAMMVVVGAECGESGKVNECSGLGCHRRTDRWLACIPGNEVIQLRATTASVTRFVMYCHKETSIFYQ